ncbi:MAG: sugar-binding protein [Verrucomicrobiae bacterium]|nr:sugar-binding protein [Verrucomicrobiae bacterium]
MLSYLFLIRNLILSSFFFLAAALPAGGLKWCQAGKVSIPPKIDGVLDDAVWKNAERNGPFVSATYVGSGAAEETFFSVLHDENALYFGVECRESRMNELVARHGAQNNKSQNLNLWKDDCVEIFIDPKYSRHSYYHFIANSAGARNEESSEEGKAWSGAWEVRGGRGEKAWFVEAAIPFSTLKIKWSDGMLLGMNVNRAHYAGGSVEFSSWSDTGASFHQPDKFGQLLVNPKACLRKTILPLLNQRLVDVKKELAGGLKGDSGPVAEKFKKMDLLLAETLETAARKDPVSLRDASAVSEKAWGLLDALSGLKDEMKCPALELWF